MSDINTLKQKFSIPGIVTIEPGNGGLTRIAVTTRDAEAHIYLHGAHVTHYRPAGGKDVLFMSGKSLFQAGKAIRGGVPMIFPWFGAKAGDSAAPMHGFARTSAWELTDARQSPDGSVSITLELASSEATRKSWPFEFALRYVVTVGTTLDLSLETRNLSAGPITFEEAFHTYLTVGDVRTARVEGLAGRDFLDKTDGAKRKTQPPGPIAITGETDRVYLHTTDMVSVTDTALARRLIVDKRGSRTTVLWNPWIAKAKAMADFGDDEWPAMVCIETANAAEDAVTLPPGQTHKMAASIIAKTGAKGDRPGTNQWEMSGGAKQ